MSTAPEPTPLTSFPTLTNVPSFSVTADMPALVPIPMAAATALSALVDHANAIRPPEMAAGAHAVQPVPSFIDDDDYEPALEDFFDPQPTTTSKGKGKAVAPPASPSVAGPSNDAAVHPFLKRIDYVPGQKPTKYGVNEHRAGRRDLDALYILGSILWANWWLYAFESRVYSHQFTHRTEPKINRTTGQSQL
ncbi:hypothetical protein C8J57DRAFT_1542263 [Mycena rebaudengoi]|nr:hypothetical protein C8J57DRAFT_1542263 [Mycena rebaudengoi]